MNACNILEVSLTFLELADSCMCKCVLVFINMWGDMTVHRAMIFFFLCFKWPLSLMSNVNLQEFSQKQCKKCCALSYSICRKKVKIKRKILPRECYILFASPTAPPAPQKCKNKHFQVLQKNVLYRTALLCKILRNSIQATADTLNQTLNNEWNSNRHRDLVEFSNGKGCSLGKKKKTSLSLLFFHL